MPVATVERPVEPVEQLVSRPEQATLYMSRRNELRLVRAATRNRYNAEGSKIETLQGESLTFTDGSFRVPLRGKVGIDKGMKVPVDELRAWLEGDPEAGVEPHRLFGDREEGFWRVDAVAPPVSEVELERLTELTTDLDIPRLGVFIEQEEAGWARERLLVAARKALARVEEAMTRLRAEERDALAKAREEGRSEGSQAPPEGTGEVKAAEPTAETSKGASGAEG